MLYTAANTTRTSYPPLGLSGASDHGSWSVQPVVCAACDSGVCDLVYGDDPDGFVLCRECSAPLFYCDLGGQG